MRRGRRRSRETGGNDTSRGEVEIERDREAKEEEAGDKREGTTKWQEGKDERKERRGRGER